MTLEQVAETINQTTTVLMLVAIAVFGFSYTISSIIRGAPIPFEDWKRWSHSAQTDVIKASFLLAVYSAIVNAVQWVASVLVSAG